MAAKELQIATRICLWLVYIMLHKYSGKSRLKYEMRSYQEMVVNQMRQMSEDNQQLIWLKNKVVKEQVSKKALEESNSMLSEKLRQTLEENRVLKLRTKKHHEQNKEEVWLKLHACLGAKVMN